MRGNLKKSCGFKNAEVNQNFLLVAVQNVIEGDFLCQFRADKWGVAKGIYIAFHLLIQKNCFVLVRH